MPGMRTSLTMQPELDGSAPRQQLLGPGIGADRVAGVFEQLREGFPHSLVVFHDMDDTFASQESMPPRSQRVGRAVGYCATEFARCTLSSGLCKLPTASLQAQGTHSSSV